MNEEQKQMIEEFRKLPGYDVNALLRTNVEEFLIKWSDTLLQKEREAGKREGIEDLKKLIEKSRGSDYHNIGIGELDYHEKCAVDAYIETLKSRMSKLKSQSVEKGNDFKFDNKGNSIP